MVFFQDTRKLTDEVIDLWVTQAEEAYLRYAGKRADSTVKFKLSLEELLLRFRDIYGTRKPCMIRGIRRFNSIYFELSQHAAPQNPLDTDSEEDQAYDILARLNLKPQYTYLDSRKLNIVTVPVPMKPVRNAMLKNVLACAALSVLTWLISGLLPSYVLDGYIIPLISGIFSKMSSVFSAIATPLVFFAVISGICGIGDITAFGRLGGLLLKRMMLTYCIAMAAMLAVGLPMGLASLGMVSSGENVFSEILNLILDIIPGNLIEPFRIDNDMQVIVIAVFIGVIILTLREKLNVMMTLLNEAVSLINRMMLSVCKLMPLFVYLGFTNLLLSGNLSELRYVSKILIMCLGGAAITIGITILRTLIVTKLSFRELFTAQLPSLIINLTTSSQVSALPESMKCCKEKWKIDMRFTDFGLPLGIVFYMPNGAVLLGSVVWGLSAMSSGPLDPFTLIKVVLVAVIVAIAAPPIPGSALAVLPILFSACGTDFSLMPFAVIIASTAGYLLPAMNGYCLQLELLMSAYRSGCVKK